MEGQGGPSLRKEFLIALVLLLASVLASVQKMGAFIHLSGYLFSHPLLSTYSGIILVPGHTARS